VLHVLPISSSSTNHFNYAWRRVQVMSSLSCFLLHPSVTSSLFGLNILLSTLFSNTFSLCSFLNVRYQVSLPYRTTGKIIILYIIMPGSIPGTTKKKVVGLERGPLSLVSTTEELLDRKVAAPV
jgi:hypothetical protein